MDDQNNNGYSPTERGDIDDEFDRDAAETFAEFLKGRFTAPDLSGIDDAMFPVPLRLIKDMREHIDELTRRSSWSVNAIIDIADTLTEAPPFSAFSVSDRLKVVNRLLHAVKVLARGMDKDGNINQNDIKNVHLDD